MAKFEMFKLKGIIPLALEGSHQLFRHPFNLGLCKLNHVVADVVAQGQRVGQQTGLLVLPQLKKKSNNRELKI
jgi:hypothetical protein